MHMFNKKTGEQINVNPEQREKMLGLGYVTEEPNIKKAEKRDENGDDLDGMTKPQLVKFVQDNNLDVNTDQNKEELLNAVKQAVKGE